MKTALLPFVNLDAATTRALPLAPVQARAQFRFCFRLPDGDSTWLLARLCAVQAYSSEHSRYCMVLRPEDAEPSRVFVREQAAYHSSLRETMTADEAENYDWYAFAREFNNGNRDCSRLLARYWEIEAEDNSADVKFRADQTAEVVGAFRMDVGGGQLEEGFNWDDSRPFVSASVAEMNLLRTSHADFDRQVQVQWADANNQLREAVLWAQLDESQRNESVFKCENGNWAQLRTIATLVLQVRLNSALPQIESRHHWNLVGLGSFNIIEVDADHNSKPSPLCEDEALSSWRAALLELLRPINVLKHEREDHSLPRYLSIYLAHHQQASVEVAPPSMHEAMEAQLQLRDWAHAHFASDEAARLLELL